MTTSMATAISSLLKTSLDRLYGDFNYPDSATDPIHIVRRFERADDREIVGFCAAALAFGRVASVLQSIERLLAVLGPRPGRVRAVVRGRGRRVDFSGLGHRWIRSRDLVALIRILRRDARSLGIGRAFLRRRLRGRRVRRRRRRSTASPRRALALDCRRQRRVEAVARASAISFPRPSAGSACKRLNLFLRWMVRRDALDLGVWTTRAGVGARRAARHARHPGRTLPRADALRQPRLGDGPGDHRRAAARSTRAIP